ncbi:MAG TPA: HEAT repeat domain-containing protein [Gemmatimonadaceae bacterium]|jgi:hypothetical protein
MTRHTLVLGLLAAVAARTAMAQSLMRRVVNGSDGPVQFTFASRPGVCGDGATFIRDGFGGNNRIYDGGNFSGHSRGDDWPPCGPGPVRIVASVSGGEIVRLHTYAGPRRAGDSPPRDLGMVSVGDAAGFLTNLVEQAHGRAASDAILPLVLADSIVPWPTLLRFARDEQLPRATRNTVSFWLARGAAAKLGLADRDDDDDDDVRASAVFALSQQPKESAIPELIEVARGAPHPAARAQALFWLGQSGDPRAVDLFEEILRRR